MTITNLSEEFTKEVCITCGVLFFFPTTMHTQVKNNKQTFYCPSGHSMSYTKSALEYANDKIKERDSLLLSRSQYIAKLERENKELSKKPRKRKAKAV